MFTFKFNDIDGMVSLNDDFIYIKLIVNGSVVNVYEKNCIRQHFNAPDFFKLINIYEMMHECINKKNYNITVSDDGAHMAFNMCQNDFIKLEFNVIINTKTLTYDENSGNEMIAKIKNLEERIAVLEVNQCEKACYEPDVIENTKLISVDTDNIFDQNITDELRSTIFDLKKKSNEMEEILKNLMVSVYSNTQTTGTYKLYDKHISMILTDNRCTINFGCIQAFKKLETLNIHVGQMNLSRCCDDKCMEHSILCNKCNNDCVKEITLRHDGIRFKNTQKFKMFNLENFPNLEHIKFELTRILSTDEIINSLKTRTHKIKRISFKACHGIDMSILQIFGETSCIMIVMQ